MERKNQSAVGVLTTWPLLICLVILLANDWVLKDVFHNFITGKLSDFSGVAIIALLLLSMFRKQKIWAHILIIITFSWWKSPWSEGFIQLFNHHSPLNIGRIIDYEDLWALLVLPACHYVASNTKRFTIGNFASSKAVQIPLAAIALFAILGTSIVPRQQIFAIQPISEAEILDRNGLLNEISIIAYENDLTCVNCSSNSENLTFEGNEMRMTCTFLQNGSVKFKIHSWSDRPLVPQFGPDDQERIDALRKSLKLRLGKKFKGLEYVEPLDNPYF